MPPLSFGIGNATPPQNFSSIIPTTTSGFGSLSKEFSFKTNGFPSPPIPIPRPGTIPIKLTTTMATTAATTAATALIFPNSSNSSNTHSSQESTSPSEKTIQFLHSHECLNSDFVKAINQRKEQDYISCTFIRMCESYISQMTTLRNSNLEVIQDHVFKSQGHHHSKSSLSSSDKDTLPHQKSVSNGFHVPTLNLSSKLFGLSDSIPKDSKSFEFGSDSEKLGTPPSSFGFSPSSKPFGSLTSPSGIRNVESLSPASLTAPPNTPSSIQSSQEVSSKFTIPPHSQPTPFSHFPNVPSKLTSAPSFGNSSPQDSSPLNSFTNPLQSDSPPILSKVKSDDDTFPSKALPSFLPATTSFKSSSIDSGIKFVESQPSFGFNSSSPSFGGVGGLSTTPFAKESSFLPPTSNFSFKQPAKDLNSERIQESGSTPVSEFGKRLTPLASPFQVPSSFTSFKSTPTNSFEIPVVPLAGSTFGSNSSSSSSSSSSQSQPPTFSFKPQIPSSIENQSLEAKELQSDSKPLFSYSSGSQDSSFPSFKANTSFGESNSFSSLTGVGVMGTPKMSFGQSSISGVELKPSSSPFTFGAASQSDKVELNGKSSIGGSGFQIGERPSVNPSIPTTSQGISPFGSSNSTSTEFSFGSGGFKAPSFSSPSFQPSTTQSFGNGSIDSTVPSIGNPTFGVQPSGLGFGSSSFSFKAPSTTNFLSSSSSTPANGIAPFAFTMPSSKSPAFVTDKKELVQDGKVSEIKGDNGDGNGDDGDGGVAGGEEGSDEPTIPESQPQSTDWAKSGLGEEEESVIFEGKCAFFESESGSWIKKGVMTLRVNQSRPKLNSIQRTRLLGRLDNGKVLLNLNLSAMVPGSCKVSHGLNKKGIRAVVAFVKDSSLSSDSNDSTTSHSLPLNGEKKGTMSLQTCLFKFGEEMHGETFKEVLEKATVAA